VSVLSAEKQRLIVLAIWDGCGVRSAALAAGVHRDTVSDYLSRSMNLMFDEPLWPDGSGPGSWEDQFCAFPPPLRSTEKAWLTWAIEGSTGYVDNVSLSADCVGSYQSAPFWLDARQRACARMRRFRTEESADGWISISAMGWNTKGSDGKPSPAEKAGIVIGADPAAWLVGQIGWTSDLVCEIHGRKPGKKRARGPVDWMGRPREGCDAQRP